MASRSEERAQSAIDSIRKELGEDKTKIDFVKLDLTDLNQVKGAADALVAKDIPIHILVNNAGVSLLIPCKRLVL
jgi:short-subunit dehydrogenase